MKKYVSLTLALALMAALCTGCGCAANVSTHPGGMITEETTRPTVMPRPTATHETTRPTEMTLPTVTGSDPTGESGAGSMGGDVGGSGGTNDGTGTNESTTPTDGTMPQRGRPRNATR